MAGAGFGRGMALIAAGEDDAMLQPRQATRKARAIFGEKIGAQLIDRNDDEQFGRRRRRSCAILGNRRRADRGQGQSGKYGESHILAFSLTARKHGIG